MDTNELQKELEAINIGIDVVMKEARRQRKLAETFKDNIEAYKFHTIKAHYFEQAIKIIGANKAFYLANHGKLKGENNAMSEMRF